MTIKIRQLFNCGAATMLVVALSFVSLTGCEPKEDVMEVETPSGELEVERSPETGEVDVEVED